MNSLSISIILKCVRKKHSSFWCTTKTTIGRLSELFLKSCFMETEIDLKDASVKNTPQSARTWLSLQIEGIHSVFFESISFACCCCCRCRPLSSRVFCGFFKRYWAIGRENMSRTERIRRIWGQGTTFSSRRVSRKNGPLSMGVVFW